MKKLDEEWSEKEKQQASDDNKDEPPGIALASVALREEANSCADK